ncbi:MAG: 50S ribosomal protein L30 [Candidatus Altiarchaeota archaeon]
MDRSKRLAVVRIRGKVHVRSDIADTLKLVGLNKINHCVVLDDRPAYRGMISKINDYVAWGELNEKTFEDLLIKRGRVVGNRPFTEEYIKKNSKSKDLKSFVKDFLNFKFELSEVAGLKPVFRLKPPNKGFERAGIKRPYSRGGVLGNRGDKINQLIERMI